MLKRILVANRGEIAARILRACREMNIETVAVFSEADRGSLFTTLANRAVCIGAPHASQSYLNQDAIMTTALHTGCDAVHPGFGFLSENPAFAQLVETNGLTFVGPSSSTISLLGDKSAARGLMRQHGIPVVPGSNGTVATAEEALEVARALGFPVLVKAAAGGGGRGMRRVDNEGQMGTGFSAACAEALACFGDAQVYVEKLVVNPRHIEFQILADAHGATIHLGERDCSLQRNHQKVLEEAPAQVLDDEMRTAMGAVAVKAAQAAGYVNAGTVEFIVDGDAFYFIEMNTRIQVEHPVTEMVTGVNIVREQIRIASGLPLRLTQEEVVIDGHAIECRINAEEPAHGFRPCPGTVEHLHLPNGFGVRVDTALHAGCTLSPYYDSMIAKVIVHGHTRNEAILRMRRALEETVISGVKTNVGLLYMLMYRPEFLGNHIDTGFIERNLDTLLQPVKEEATL
ncbi:MAG: acetyl-CoA carboxylase biotin carboxylase subunit [Coriobacteriales bacterium]|jgi:acetyl-CoA carboxylase biotin carboxylase subunit|nr:acetyl-CoA carboxylase biotin carboxylase subunit [Coriobacteriales bacterium]